MPRSGRRPDAAHPAQLEYLGTTVTVVASAHPPFAGLTGRVVDETRNTFLVETAAGEVRVPKTGQVFAVQLPDGSVAEIEGRDIRFRPEDRIKKARTRPKGSGPDHPNPKTR